MSIDFSSRTALLRQAGAVVAAWLAVISATSAHHSPAAFDTRKTQTITGVVKKYEWFNPHVYITLEQTTETGQRIDLEIECPPPSMMNRLGWNKETLRVGDVLSISGNPARNAASNAFLAGTIKRADETLMNAGDFFKNMSPDPKAPKFVANNLEGIWLGVPNIALLTQIATPNASQLTEEGARILKGFDEKTVSPAANCIPMTAPINMLIPDLKQIAIKDGLMTIRSEFDGGARTIRLNESSHDGAIVSHQGHSIAKWEGNTLVVESTHFAYHALGYGLGVPSGSQKRLVEKFTLSTDRTSLTYEFELQDPQFLKATKKAQLVWSYRPDMKFAPEPCSLENARRFTKY